MRFEISAGLNLRSTSPAPLWAAGVCVLMDKFNHFRGCIQTGNCIFICLIFSGFIGDVF